jgi:hypothetical protein
MHLYKLASKSIPYLDAKSFKEIVLEFSLFN